MAALRSSPPHTTFHSTTIVAAVVATEADSNSEPSKRHSDVAAKDTSTRHTRKLTK